MAIAYSFDCFGLSYSLNMKTDDTDPDFTYIGYCVPGTLASETGWAIIRITKADGGNANLNTASWANGIGLRELLQLNSPKNTIIWNHRADGTYTYDA